MSLFGFGQPACPVDDERKSSIDQQAVWLRDEFGLEAVRSATVVLPTRAFFPRAGERSIQEIEDAFQRVAGFLGVPLESIRLWLYEPEEVPLARYRGQWETHGAAGLFHATPGSTGPQYYVGLRVDQIADPCLLVAILAHELAHARLHGHLTGQESQLEQERLTDLATVFFGLGIFTSNAILQERKGHNPWIEGAGWSIGRVGYLRGPEFGYALAVFAWWRGERKPEWKKYLRPDVQVPFKQTLTFFERSGGVGVP